MILTWKKHKIKLHQPFVLSYGAYDFRWSYMVQLVRNGHVGLGEATAITYYGWTEEKLGQELTDLGNTIQTEDDILRYLAEDNISPPVRNALQCAYVDLLAREQKMTLSAYYKIDNTKLPLSTITITGNTVEEFNKQIQDYDWPIYKIKMGSEHDDVQLKIIRSHPDKLFRIDANAGWTIEWIKKHAAQLNAQNVELIEQPFPVDQPELNLELKKYIDKNIYADESCRTIDDISSCGKYFDGVNVKLMKSGGWDRALAIMKRARDENLRIMIGCMTETSIGISHASHLIGLADEADVDGAVLIANDIAHGTTLKQGIVTQNPRHGCGAKLIT